jgi:hypothetical protein
MARLGNGLRVGIAAGLFAAVGLAQLAMGAPSNAVSPDVVTCGTSNTISGPHSSLIVNPHQTVCLYEADITGGISVHNGSLIGEDSLVQGSISVDGGNTIQICDSTTGALTITGVTNQVIIGGTEECGNRFNISPNLPSNGGNHINGGVTIANNRACVEVIDNSIAGSLLVTHNGPTIVSGNHTH